MEARLAKKRARDREYQRKRRKNDIEIRLQGHNEELRQQILRSNMYLTFLSQSRQIKRSQFCHLRRLLVELFADYFKYGAKKSDKYWFQRQQVFLSHIFSKSVQGMPETFLDQMAIYTMLHDHVIAKKTIVQVIDPNHEIFALTRVLECKIARRTIKGLYPTMLENHEFLRKSIGKVLELKVVFMIYFGETNKIEALTQEWCFAESWCKLLQDPILVAQVIKGMRRNPKTGLLTISHQDLHELTTFMEFGYGASKEWRRTVHCII